MPFPPSEIHQDVLLPLDRWTLDDVQFTNGRFMQLVTDHMTDVCLRQDGNWVIRVDGRAEQRKTLTAHEDVARLFSEFLQFLRSSRVTSMALNGLAFTPGLAALILQTPLVTEALGFNTGNCTALTPTQFQKVILHLSPTYLDIEFYKLRAYQVNDELLRALCENHVRQTGFHDLVPADGGKFHLTDDAVVDFCVQEDVPTSVLSGQLVVGNGSFTKDLFKRLVEASSASIRTQPLRIVVSPSPVQEADLRDFAQYLSFRRSRFMPRELRIYNFPGYVDGAVAVPAMHLQIVLHPDNRLEMIRARPLHAFFFEADQ